MIGVMRVALLAAVACCSLPRVALAQTATADSLRRRIDQIERTTAELERRLHELEMLVKREPSRAGQVPASSKWRDLQNWRRLRRGMTMDEVRALLGEPERVEAMGVVGTFWQWDSGRASVRFDGFSGKLDAWSEPGSEGR